MRARVVGANIFVTLSRRNLKALLLKLDQPTSALTLVKLTGGYLLSVKGEEDEAHYLVQPEGDDY
jgi:hypothetical protein